MKAEYQAIEKTEHLLEKLVQDYFEEKILADCISEPSELQRLRSKTLWTITSKKREEILNAHSFTMLQGEG